MNRGDISLIDNDLPGRLTIDEGSSNVDVENNVFGNSITILKKPTGILKLIDNEVTIGSEYVISISFDSIDQNTFRNISGNYRIGERFNAIKITGTPTTNVKLTKQNYVLIDDIVILEGKMFEVEAGSSLQIGDKRSVTVNGVLNISGSLSDPIHITNTSDSYDYRWIGFLISPTGKAFISNTTIMYAGDYYHAPIENQGQLIMWNSEIRQGYSSKAINYNTSNLDQILINNSLHGTVNSNIPLQAAYNYWGYSTGPKVYDPINDKYTGGAYLISNNVSFYPYYLEFVENDLESIEFLDTYVYEMPHFGQTGVNFTGNYSKQYIDFEFLNINRVYNSKSEKKDIFGFGWSFGYSSRIEPHPFLKNTYLVYLPDSSIAIFEHKENGYVSLNNRSTLEKKNDKYIFTTKEKEVYTYNLEGKLETITDVYGNVTTLTYNKNGLLEKITDHVNRSYTLKYNEDQLVTKITDPIGRSIEYQYQGELLQKVTSFNGMVTEYAYNSKKQLTSIKEDGMRVLGLKYIESGTYKDRIYELTEALGNKKIYSYNGTDSLTIETDSDDRVTKTYYDRDGFEYKVIDPNGTMTTTTYLLEDGANKYGEIATFTKINSAKTIYTRDSVGNVTKITNPDGSTKQYVYNSKNKVVKETDELGNIKEYIYDSDQVTLLKEVIPLNGTTLYSETEDQSKYQMTTYTYYEPSEVYEIPNLVKTKTDQNGTTIYTYDSYGNVISITDANKQKTTYIKNKLDWTLTEQNQYLTEYEYDVSGNVTKVIKDSHLVSMTEYNNRNKPEKVMDGNCNIAPKKIDPFEVKTFETTTCDYSYYRYNALGNLIEETDKEGNITTYSYDQYGNMYFKTNPDGSIELYEFDLLHRLVKSYFKENDESDLILLEEKSYTVGSSSSIITNEYIDEFHVKTKVETYNNRDLLVSEQVGEQTKTKTYLKNGLVSSEKDANGNYTYYYYNKRNLLEKKYEPVSGSSYICTVYVYDVFGRVIEEKVGKGTVSNGSTPSSFVITYYEYNDLGQVIKKKTSSNEEIVYTYDSLGRVTKEKTKMNADIYSLKEYEYNYLDKVVKEKEGDLVTTSEYDNVGNLIKTTSGENVVTTYEYDKKNRLVQKMLDSKVEEKLTYDLNGNITSKTDPNGNVTHYVYDKRNHLLEEKNPKGFLTTYTYDYLGRKLSETTPNGKVMIYTYDDYGNMITKSIGDSTYTYEYDKNNNKVKETTPLGFSTIYTYDKRNRVLTKKDPLGAIHSYSYDSFDHVTSERDENGNYIYYTYDERGNVLQKKVGSVVVEQNEYDLMNHLLKKMDGNSNVTMYTYNVLGQLIKKQDPLSYTEEYTYNKNGDLVSIVDNVGKTVLHTYDHKGNVLETTIKGEEHSKTEKKEYDSNNNLVKEIDFNGNETLYTYDCFDKVIKKVNPLNQETVYEYDNDQNLIKETNYLGDSKVFVYDSYGRLVTRKNELGEVIESLEYDLDSRQVKSIDGLNGVITYVYDGNNRVVETIDQASNSEKSTYDGVGNVLTKTDKNGNVTSYQYDVFGNVIKVTNALGEVTSYTYDKNNNLLSVLNGNGKKTIYTYDKMNHELTEKDPLGNVETKVYNTNGTLKKKTDRNGNVILYTYDVFDRLIKENDIVYQYDGNDNLLKVVKGDHSIVREYDGLNRVVKKAEDGLVTTFVYNGYQEETTDPKQNKTVKKYDKAGRLIEVENEASYVYNLDGTLKKVTYQNGSVTDYQYNLNKTLQSVTHTRDEEIESFTYGYDHNQNMTKKIEKGEEISYTYDVLNRLSTITDGLENVTTYSYDKVGNRIKEVGATTKDYVYDANHRLLSVSEVEGEVVHTTQYTYDNNGNQLTEVVDSVLKQSNTYDSDNQLVKSVVDGVETTYVYNGEGKRIQKKNGDSVIKYVYEGMNIILELDSSNNELAHNQYGLSLVSRDTGSKGYYLYNGHGDTVSIVDSSNEILNTYVYDEWGKVKEKIGSFDNPYLYVGYYYDSETNNYYLLSRYYNPSIGRFTSEDSYRGDYNDPLSLNRYVYVTNSPLIYMDPEGYFGERIGKFLKDLWEETINLGVSFGAVIQGGVQAGVEAIAGLGQLVIDGGTLFLYGSAAVGNELYYKAGLESEKNYKQNLEKYTSKVIDSGKRLNPVKAISGIIDNFKNTFNLENMSKFADKDTPYKDKVVYAKEATKTVATIYGGYKVGTSVYDKVTSPSSFGIMSKVDSSGYQNYWNQVKQGVSVEQRYNLQKFGDQTTFVDYMTLDDMANYNQYWNQVKQGLTAEQRYNYKLYGDVEGSLNYKIVMVRQHESLVDPQYGTIFRKIDDNGIMQDKIIGKDGELFKDIDFYHSDSKNNHIFPHEHWYNHKVPDKIEPRSSSNKLVWEKELKRKK